MEIVHLLMELIGLITSILSRQRICTENIGMGNCIAEGCIERIEDTRHFARGIVSQKDRALGKQRKATKNPAKVSTKERAFGKDFQPNS